MFPFERYQLIIEEVKRDHFVSIPTLMKVLNCSLTTLRRDIDHLVRDGKIKKTRGGVIGTDVNDNSLYDKREKLFYKEKEAIGIAAQRFIEDMDIIILTNGTTTSQVARHIDEKKRITVITNGLDILHVLRNKPNVKVILLGGVVDYSNLIVTGPSLPKMLNDFCPSKIIMGAGGISEEKGITIYDFVGSSYFVKLVEKVKERIVVADHSKFGRDVLVRIAGLDEINTIITDKNVPSQYIDIFNKYKINYLMV
jgi:DeoR/GlpR family transcriptional regulator of sugar metabolism